MVKERWRLFCAHPFYCIKLPPPLGGLPDPPGVVNVDCKLYMRCSQLRSLRGIGCSFDSRITWTHRAPRSRLSRALQVIHPVHTILLFFFRFFAPNDTPLIVSFNVGHTFFKLFNLRQGTCRRRFLQDERTCGKRYYSKPRPVYALSHIRSQWQKKTPTHTFNWNVSRLHRFSNLLIPRRE